MNQRGTSTMENTLYFDNSPQMTDANSLISALNSVCNNLKNTVSDGTISTDGFSEAETIERLTENMQKRVFLSSSIKRYGEPTRLGGKYERYGWRPFGYKGAFVRAKTIEQVYEKAWKIYKENKENESLTLREALDKYIEYKIDVKNNTHQKYRDNLEKFLSQYMDEPLSSLTQLQIENAYKYTIVNDRPSLKTVKGFRGTLERVLKHVKKHYDQKLRFDIDVLLEDLRENTNKKLLKSKKTPLLFEDNSDRYSIDQANQFIAECLNRNNIRSLAAALIFFTGCRASEICGMFKSDVDCNVRTIHICHAAFIDKPSNTYYISAPKEDKERIIVYPDIADKILDKILLLNLKSDTYMFPNSANKKVAEWTTIRQVDNEIESICKTIGMVKKSAHDIRRTYDSLLDEAKLPSGLRHLLLGHELTGIDYHYLRDSHSVDEVRAYINKAFEKFELNNIE